MRSFLKNEKGLVPVQNWEPKCWINIEIPTEAEKDYLINELLIPEAFYNDIEDVDERPRIEIEDGWYLIIIRVPYKSSDEKVPFSTVPLGLIFKDDFFISVCFYKTDLISDFVIYSQRKNIIKENNFDMVLKLLLSSSVWYLKYLKQINLNIKLAELQLEKSIKNEELQRLLLIEKCLVIFTTSLKGNDILSHRIKTIKDYKESFDPELVEDVEIELRQAQETTKIYSDILSGMMDAYASVISNNLNMIMKQLTLISIMLMIPTLIASFYGMNVSNYFENGRYSFIFIVIISLILSMVGFLWFRRKKWF